jgi:hypothetical protein
MSTGNEPSLLEIDYLAFPGVKLGSDKLTADKKGNYRPSKRKRDTVRYLGRKYLGVWTITSSYPARAPYVGNDRGLCWLVKSA